MEGVITGWWRGNPRFGSTVFRCVKYVEPESIPKIATDSIPSPLRDLVKKKPVSNELFQAYRSLYSFDKTPLNASPEAFGKDEEDWKAERSPTRRHTATNGPSPTSSFPRTP